MRINAEALIPFECFGKKYTACSIVVSYLSIELERNKRRKEPKDLRTNYLKLWNICMSKNTQKTPKAYFCLPLPFCFEVDHKMRKDFLTSYWSIMQEIHSLYQGAMAVPVSEDPGWQGRTRASSICYVPSSLLRSNHLCPTIQGQSWSCFIKTNMNVILTML